MFIVSSSEAGWSTGGAQSRWLIYRWFEVARLASCSHISEIPVELSGRRSIRQVARLPLTMPSRLPDESLFGRTATVIDGEPAEWVRETIW